MSVSGRLQCAVCENVLAGQLDGSAFGSRGVEQAARLHRAALAAGKHDLAALVQDRARDEVAIGDDDIVDQPARGLRRELDLAAFGGNGAIHLNQRGNRVAVLVLGNLENIGIDREIDQAVAVKIERELGAGRQRNRAQLGGDDAGVARMRRDKSDKAGIGGGDRAVIDD